MLERSSGGPGPHKLASTAEGGISQMQPRPRGAYYVPSSPRWESEGLWEEKPVGPFPGHVLP